MYVVFCKFTRVIGIHYLTAWGCLTNSWYLSRPIPEITLIQHLLPTAGTLVPFSPYGQTPKRTFWLLPCQTWSPPFHAPSACSLLTLNSLLLTEHNGGSSCQQVKRSYLLLGYLCPIFDDGSSHSYVRYLNPSNVIISGSMLAQIKINTLRTFQLFS